MDRIQALREQRVKLMHDASAILQQDNLTTEHEQQANKMIADADVLEARIASLDRIGKFEAEQRSAPRPPREQINGADAQKTEHRDALRNFILKGETRDILTTGSGAALLQPQFYPELVTALKSYGNLANAVDFLQTETGNDMKVAMPNDLARGLTPIAENAPVTRRDPVLPVKDTQVEKFETQEIYLTNEQLTDSYFSLEDWLTNSLLEAYYRGISELVTLGSTAVGSTLGRVESLVNGATVGSNTTAAPAAINYADLIGIYGQLDAKFLQDPSCSWVMSSATRAYLMSLTLTTGEPLLTNANSGGFTQLLGKPIVISEYMSPVGAGNKAILFGALKKAYTLRQVGNISIRRITELYAKQDAVSFFGIVRLGGFSKYQAGNGAAPLLALQQKAS